jgi:type II secretory pathway component PulF
MDPATAQIIRDAIAAISALGVAYMAFKTAELGRTMQTLEKNTNSIKDALVATTHAAAFAAGVKDEKDRTHEINRQVEEGKKFAP